MVEFQSPPKPILQAFDLLRKNLMIGPGNREKRREENKREENKRKEKKKKKTNVSGWRRCVIVYVVDDDNSSE